MFNNNNAITHKSANSNSSRSMTYSSTTNSFQRSPKFAIVRLSDGTDVLRLYQLLLENGFPEVSFVNEMRENAFLPYSMQNQSQPQQQKQNNDRSNLLLSGDSRANSVMAVERKASFESVRRESQQQFPPSVQLPAATSVPSRVARPSAVLGKSPLGGRASSSSAPSSNSQHSSHRTAVRATTTSRIIADDVALCPAISAASPASSSSSNTVANGGGPNSVVPLASTPATGGKKSDEYAVCLLCNNRIMSSRLSNLTNHVRRHASLKQYRCCHCQYSHNEMAKVRLHMSHNHQDFTSQPMDMLSFEMQLQWGLLMEQCFPEHSKRFGPSAANSQFRNLEELQKYVDMEHSYTCIECGEVLTGYQLVTHLEDVHRQECVPFACGQCGYQSSSQWKVRLHISVKHPERAAEITVATLPAGSNFMLFLQKFFAEVHIPVEEDEAKLVAELQEKNSNRLLAAMNSLNEETDAIGNEDECEESDEEKEGKYEGSERREATASQSPQNLKGEEKEREEGNEEENEEEEGEEEGEDWSAKKEGERTRRTSAPLEDGEEGNVRPQPNDRTNIGKKLLSVRKRENSLSTEHGETEEQPTAKRHNLRHSNRLLMVAEKRNISLGSSGTAATPAAVGTPRKK
ncbi:hypothetical protein niasHT_038037 [Heterodera trifolii]|uniref:C2H2-type domain-containing protein n=1 Tax=Heterodera trifolii TaxID=157864 RepID=A0ABD2HNH6_9BILA